MLRSGIVISLHTMRAEGKSIREIARLTGHSRNTVRRYLPKREPVNLVVPSLIRINRSCRNVFKKVSITARFYSIFYKKRDTPVDAPS